MPKKKHSISDEERRKRLREAGRAHETSDDPTDFEKAFKAVISPVKPKPKANA
ncbi:MAG: hypothetical protein ACREHE_04200 [Rhizomicrobium sp.]